MYESRPREPEFRSKHVAIVAFLRVHRPQTTTRVLGSLGLTYGVRGSDNATAAESSNQHEHGSYICPRLAGAFIGPFLRIPGARSAASKKPLGPSRFPTTKLLGNPARRAPLNRYQSGHPDTAKRFGAFRIKHAISLP